MLAYYISQKYLNYKKHMVLLHQMVLWCSWFYGSSLGEANIESTANLSLCLLHNSTQELMFSLHLLPIKPEKLASMELNFKIIKTDVLK